MLNENDVIQLEDISSDDIINDKTHYDILVKNVDIYYDEDNMPSVVKREICLIYNKAKENTTTDKDKQRLMDILNEYFSKNDIGYEVTKIERIIGPGGGWPMGDIVYRNIRIEEFIKEDTDDIEERFGEIKITKVYK